MDEYLLNLLERMASDVWLPAKEGETRCSGTHSIAFIAYREAEKVTDLRILSPIQNELKKKISKDRFRHLLFILSHLAMNTHEPLAISTFIDQIKRKGLNNRDLAAWVSSAEQCRIVEAEPFIGALLDVRHWEVLTDSLKYCETMKSKCYLDKICEILDYDCYSLCHPMYAIFALKGIKDEKAIPALERAIKRHEGSRKKEDKEVVFFAYAAISTIHGEEVEYIISV